MGSIVWRCFTILIKNEIMKSSIKYIINDKFEFDYTNKKITYILNGDKRKVLTPAANILLFLIKNKVDGDNEVISQDELFSAGWGEKKKFVTINTFYQNILLLRKAFSELEHNFEIIKNIPKRGYRLVDDIHILNSSINNVNSSRFRNKHKIDRKYDGKIEKIHIPKVEKVENHKNISINTPPKYPSGYIKKKNVWLSFSNREVKRTIIMLVLIVLMTTIFFSYIDFQKKSSSLSNYTHCGEINSKIILCNKQMDLNAKLSKFLSDEIISKSFDDYQYMYVIRRNFTNKLSIIYCIRELDSFSLKDNECVSYYIMDWAG
ncbi:transcriptional regulatory protein, C-terminal domain protein [Providencia alcalifaciens PAL-3]|uniref:winged helix-turn-helix domain-containing protein n=3 Tax=Morganellaceae TaxID=1903414 RepID=UPI0003E274AF|nr:winged helix-turn-helix domain-containing protein [Providencia sp. wls1950]ETT01494.1 transcriptional regulatory protein, C-terminal domain protein [Providencia alcalifaciens PAL-3]EUC98270.1 transcriptional regulatory protein, C-terminal domain protein [Providencia alcalifaciens PAL-1]MTB44625.1 hypothetical protein [Providencia sp. wls1950]